MTPGYGIKISRPGFDVNSATPEQLAFSSKYKTLKVYDRGSDTLTVTNRTITIPHNLGYVPFFLVYSQLDSNADSAALVGDRTNYFISPFRLGSAIDIFEAENTHDIIAWADTTNLYVRARENVGKDIYPIFSPFGGPNENEQMAYESDAGYTTGDWFVGNDPPVFNVEDGAVRTASGIVVDQAEAIYAAELSLYVGSRLGSSEVKMTIYGIDEDNTGPFNAGTAATARTKTTASVNHNTTVSSGEYAGADVTSIVQEIIDRAGWASGNNMGFIMNDNGTAVDNDYGETSASGSFLSVTRSSTLASFKYTIFLNRVE